MTGYLLVDVTWTDEEGRRRYVQLLGPTLTAHGGEIVAADRHAEALEGDWQPGEITVLITFPSREAALSWYHSSEYEEAQAVRACSSDSRVLVLGD